MITDERRMNWNKTVNLDAQWIFSLERAFCFSNSPVGDFRQIGMKINTDKPDSPFKLIFTNNKKPKYKVFVRIDTLGKYIDFQVFRDGNLIFINRINSNNTNIPESSFNLVKSAISVIQKDFNR